MIVKIHTSVDGLEVCCVEVTPNEAVSIIESLARQLRQGYCNGGRLESKCSGDVDEMTIAVDIDNPV